MSVVKELTDKLPEMSLARAGKSFRKSRPIDKEKPVELLLEKMTISDYGSLYTRFAPSKRDERGGGDNGEANRI